MIKNLKVKNKIFFSYLGMVIINLILVIMACIEFANVGDYTAANFFAGLGVFNLIFGFCSGYIIMRAIAKPVRLIKEAIEQLETGDVNIELHVDSTNEFGQIMLGLQKLAETSSEQAQVAKRISQGDLTVNVKPRSEVDLLGNTLYSLVMDNNETLSGIKESTSQVTIGAEQVASASQSLAQGSTQQASAIEQITSSMEEIAEKTKGNASQANSAASLVHDVKTGAHKGNEQMQEMMNAMRDINESSESISKVIKVIDDIAFQTNILALNATVEAARAGVHGKGFAVVAEEVRNLAEKSAAAANETDEMIQSSIHKVRTGSNLAEDTGKALNTILEAIDKVVELIDGIANASGEQATAVTQINQAIAQVSQVVQTNSATSEQCASASEELANQAEALRDLIGRYNLRDNSSYRNNTYTPQEPEHKQKMEYNKKDNEKIISLEGGYGKY